MSSDYWTIPQLNRFGPLTNWTCWVFRSPLYVEDFLQFLDWQLWLLVFKQPELKFTELYLLASFLIWKYQLERYQLWRISPLTLEVKWFTWQVYGSVEVELLQSRCDLQTLDMILCTLVQVKLFHILQYCCDVINTSSILFSVGTLYFLMLA